MYPINDLHFSLSSLLEKAAVFIIEHSGYDSSEAATSQFVLSCFMSRSLEFLAETKAIKEMVI